MKPPYHAQVWEYTPWDLLSGKTFPVKQYLCLLIVYLSDVMADIQRNMKPLPFSDNKMLCGLNVFKNMIASKAYLI